MKSRIIKKLLAGCLSVALLLQAGGAATVFAVGDSDAVDSGVMCENHPVHDAECGYAPGSDAVEEVPGSPCTLSHEDGAHDDTCGYVAPIPAVEAVPASPCMHSCALCAQLDPPFEAPPVEGPPPENPPSQAPPGDAPLLTQPVPLPMGASKDVTDILTNLGFTVKQNDKDIAEGGELNHTDPIHVKVSFEVPVDGDVGSPENRINTGDTATFKLAVGLSAVDMPATPLIFAGEEVGTLTISYDSDTSVTTATVIFSALVDNMDFYNVKAEFDAEMSYNGSGDADAAGDHVVQILNKNFTVVVPEKVTTITVTKEGTASVAEKVVDWKVTVDAKLEGDTVGSLQDCVFTDDLTHVGEYVADSFKIGSSEDATDAPNPTASYDTARRKLLPI